uniref:UBC core domain-containing protein n=1 Tax=Glossina brevipalpis TaxID=37001 RepID=A0A1A9VZG5_9MUSC
QNHIAGSDSEIASVSANSFTSSTSSRNVSVNPSMNALESREVSTAIERLQITLDSPTNCSIGLKCFRLFDRHLLSRSIHCSPNYQFEPPKITFHTFICYCNIDSERAISLDTLKRNWTPILIITAVLLSMCSLLTDSMILWFPALLFGIRAIVADMRKSLDYGQTAM